MIRVLLLLLNSTLLSCTNSLIAFESGSWVETGVSENVWKKAGDKAIDCGFHNLLTQEGKESNKIGFECVKRAQAHNKGFVYGTYRIPTDSYVLEILIRAPSGEYWTVVCDRMMDEEDSQLWLHRCNSLKLYKNHITYEGKKCYEKPNTDWL